MIGLKLYENIDSDEFILYFMSKSYDENWKLEQITLQSLRQFSDLLVLTKLKQNYIVYKINSDHDCLEQQLLTLKNVHLSGSEANKSTCIGLKACPLYSSIVKAGDASEMADPFCSLFDIIIENVKQVHTPRLKVHDVIELNGRVVNICEEECCFELACSQCKLNSNLNYHFDNISNISYDKSQRYC